MRQPGLGRRALSEAIGTALLVAAVVGSGIAAQRLSPGDVGLQLLENAIATGAALVAILLALGSVSGAHLNPLVSAVETIDGRLERGALGAYVGAQMAGGALGAVLANGMFGLPAVAFSTTVRSGAPVLLAEAVATFGLLVVVRGVAASRSPHAAPYAVGAYIAAAYFFTSSTSFANPAVTAARMLSDTFAGIAPSSAPGFLAAQAVGAAAAWAANRVLFPRSG